MQSKTDLECTLAHQIESSLGDSMARSIDIISSWQGNTFVNSNHSRSFTIVVELIKIASCRDKSAQ
jgi:hypothetical protein